MSSSNDNCLAYIRGFTRIGSYSGCKIYGDEK
nr:MAG TPA: hypothetical protein [Caudoviricetes sp.]